jgi:hypothetical protein
MYKPAEKEIDSQSRLLLPLSTLNLASRDPPIVKGFIWIVYS